MAMEQPGSEQMSRQDAGLLTPALKSPSQNGTSTPQPRTVGGFLVDDDEYEEDVATPKIQTAGFDGSLDVDHAPAGTPQQSMPAFAFAAPSSTTATFSDLPFPNNNVQIQTSAQPQEHAASGASHSISSAAELPTNGVPSEMTFVEPTQSVPDPAQNNSSAAMADVTKSLPKARLPHDRIGILEDRIQEDPRGDLDAWSNLIAEHKKRNKHDDVRSIYDRFFKIFPTAADHLIAYSNFELEQNNFWHAEQIFSGNLLNVPNVKLWSTYLDYVRRRNNISSDPTGSARQIVSQTYDFVLQTVGIDKDSGNIWQDYINFIKSGPGQVGGTTWQDQQKMDLLRKAYQRAVCVPTQTVQALWKEYDAFEMGLNKMTGRKFLQEKSPGYMTARSSNTELQTMTRDLIRTTLPTLPPAMGFEGDIEYMKQVDLWKQWIQWERNDPLVLKLEDEAAYKSRIIYAYKQAMMSLRFWPEIWVDAADFCFDNGLDSEGSDFLNQGATSNPESCLLAFKRADRIEMTTTDDGGIDGNRRRGELVRQPYDQTLDALYNLIEQTKQREIKAIANIKEAFESRRPVSSSPSQNADVQENTEATSSAETQMKLQCDAVRNGNAAQIKMLSKTVSFVWIALMRAIRRIQGKGKAKEVMGGFRSIFTEARKRGRLTSDVYAASALIEYHCYKDPAAMKIFERGMKLYPEDEQFALKYLKHLIAENDITNARAVFETTVNKLAQKPETLQKTKPVYTFFHDYESRYGELSQIKKLESRMSDLFPEDPQLLLFSRRHADEAFDPAAIRLIVSPTTQARPKGLPSIEIQQSRIDSPPAGFISTPQQISTISPKRSLEDSDNESLPPRKIQRADSPLKGAAGRRLDAAKRTQLRNEMSQIDDQALPVAMSIQQPSLPRDVLFLLSIIPRAETYMSSPFDPIKMIELMRGIDLTKAQSLQAPPLANIPSGQMPMFGYGQPNPYGFR